MICVISIIALYFFTNFLFVMCCLSELNLKQGLIIMALGIPILLATENSRFYKWWLRQ